MTYSSQRRKGVMLCYPFEEKRLARWKPPYLVQPKLDGVRCRAVWIEDRYLLLSSEENIIYSVPHINRALDKTKLGFELDGELYIHGKSFEEIFSITSRQTNIHPNHGEVRYHIFDLPAFPGLQFSRLNSLVSMKNYLNIYPLSLVDVILADNLEEVMRGYDLFISRGYEGIVVRHIDCPYVRKRSTFMMKFKPKREDIYKILDWKEEVSVDGIPKGRLGALVCTSDGNLFSVGSGLTDDQREELWKIKHSLPGKFVKVGYQHITPGGKVPRFPVFMEIVEKGEEDEKGIRSQQELT